MKREDLNEMIKDIIGAVDYDMYKEIYVFEEDESIAKICEEIAISYLQKEGIDVK